MQVYGFLGDWPLPDCNHPIEWMKVKVKPMHMAEYMGKGKVKPRQGPSICKFPADENKLGVKRLNQPNRHDNTPAEHSHRALYGEILT